MIIVPSFIYPCVAYIYEDPHLFPEEIAYQQSQRVSTIYRLEDFFFLGASESESFLPPFSAFFLSAMRVLVHDLMVKRETYT